MAIIQCPSCKKRISNKAKICSHCQFDLINKVSADGNSLEKQDSLNKLDRIKQRYSLQMQAMGSIILFLAGMMTWYLIGKQQLEKPSHYIEVAMIVIGFVWYVITRFRLAKFKSKG
ncbi:MAG: zinc ribbon domain-containing protein [Gammaproteobacteria bacterium]|nr:zinc ribbon domain-containing protein [Gammaproteobacteria bacterium]MDH5629905.1 zinc ribbon domain-containing protein [Gammaproteobacteria bacterium]